MSEIELVNKVVYVSSHFKEVGVNKVIKVPTGDKKKGLFGGYKNVYEKKTEFKATGFSDCVIDGERLSNDIEIAVNKLNNDGYEIVSLSTVTSGMYNFKAKFGPTGNGGYGYGYGYGYSFTEGVTIVAKRIR